jgi:tetratricopeptide (TPR) repeat protein
MIRIFAFLTTFLIVAVAPSARQPSLSGVDGLDAAYDLLLDTRFARVESALAAACGPAPDEACAVLRATATWWRIQLDPRSRALDDRFVSEADAAIAACQRWTEREPRRAEAWFYLGGAYGVRVSWKVERGERLSAARDGKRIRQALERALELDPDLVDARFGIGLYKYYAAIAPAVARFLRFLLLLPGGDREEGLRDMEAAQARGTLLTDEADYQLHWIYLWYEDEPRRALALLEELSRRHPANALFVQRIAEVRHVYFHDAAGSLLAWRHLAERPETFGTPELARTRGRLGMAEMLDALAETDRAVDLLRAVIADRPLAPYGALARAWVALGQAEDRLGRRAAAIAAYRAAIDAAPDDDPDDIEDRAEDGLDTEPHPTKGEAYRLSLAGWRALEASRRDEAVRLLERARTLAPDDDVIAVRAARAHHRRGELDQALAEYRRLIERRPNASPLARAPAFLWSGEIYESRGDSDQAAEQYQAAIGVFAADSRITDAAERALERLRR